MIISPLPHFLCVTVSFLHVINALNLPFLSPSYLLQLIENASLWPRRLGIMHEIQSLESLNGQQIIVIGSSTASSALILHTIVSVSPLRGTTSSIHIKLWSLTPKPRLRSFTQSGYRIYGLK